MGKVKRLTTLGIALEASWSRRPTRCC